MDGEDSFQKSICDDNKDDQVGDYEDIEGELGGQLGDAIGGQGGELAGEMVSPLFFLFHVALVFVARLQDYREDTIVQS